MMLLAQTFRPLLVLWDQGQVSGLKEERLRHQTPLVLLQILHRTLHWQNSDRSWGQGNKCEVTAYAVLTLVDTSGLSLFAGLVENLKTSLQAGLRFLEQSRSTWEEPNYTWIKKVTYSSNVLSATYCLAACYAATTLLESLHYGWKSSTKELVGVPEPKLEGLCRFFSKIPLFRDQPPWKLHASLMEAFIFLPRLQKARLEIFPRIDMAKDEYLEYIPFTWTSCNNIGAFLELDLLWDMMVISVLNYQADEFMESVVGTHFSGELELAEDLIKSIFARPKSSLVAPDKERLLPSPPLSEKSSSDNICVSGAEIVRKPLEKFVRFILDHERIQNASTFMLHHLTKQLKYFLLAHLKQCVDNAALSDQQQRSNNGTFGSSLSHWAWIHTISATHTSCPYSWEWIQCRITTEEDIPFTTATAEYLSSELAAHLSAMCRMYNDFGSISRDKEEGNLNSINFLEFGTSVLGCLSGNPKEVGILKLEGKKAKLFAIAEYERANVVDLQTRLLPLVSSRTQGMLKLFADTDLYGQMYVARDIASRMK